MANQKLIAREMSPVEAFKIAHPVTAEKMGPKTFMFTPDPVTQEPIFYILASEVETYMKGLHQPSPPSEGRQY